MAGRIQIVNSAMRGRIMVEVNRRAQNFGLKVSPKYLAAAERQVVYALSEAERQFPQPVNITLSRVLARHFLTGGIVHFNEDDALRYIRLPVLKHHPQRREIFRVEREIKQGRPVEPSRLRSAQDALYFLPAEQAQKWGIRHNIYDVLDGSFFNCLIRAFPLLGLVREGFKVRYWPTPEQAIRNIRFGILRADPDLEKEALEVEGLIAAKQPIDPHRLTRLRAQLLRLGGRGVQSRVGGFRRSGFFADAEDALRQAFPLLKLTTRHQFLAGFDLRDLDDLRSLLLLAMRKAGLKDLVTGSDWERVRLEPLDFGYGEVIAFRSLLKRIDRVMREARIIGTNWKWKKRGDQRRFLQRAIVEVERSAAQDGIKQELHTLRRKYGRISEDVVRWGSAWYQKLGERIFLQILGTDIQTYLKSREFWDK